MATVQAVELGSGNRHISVLTDSFHAPVRLRVSELSGDRQDMPSISRAPRQGPGIIKG